MPKGNLYSLLLLCLVCVWFLYFLLFKANRDWKNTFPQRSVTEGEFCFILIMKIFPTAKVSFSFILSSSEIHIPIE